MAAPAGRARPEAYEERVGQAIEDRADFVEAPGEDIQPRPEQRSRDEAAGPRDQVREGHQKALDVWASDDASRARETPSANRSQTGGDAATSNVAHGPSEMTCDEDVDNQDGDGDTDLGAVQEDESEEEMGIAHEDADDEISMVLLAQMGQPGEAYQRERRKECRHLVSDIYLPPRITHETKR